MHDPMLVRGLERGGHLLAEPQHLTHSKTPVGQRVGERLAIDQFHDEAAPALELSQLMQGRHMGMIQRRQCPRLAPEP